MANRSDRVKVAILKVLQELDGPAGATRITAGLSRMGVMLQPRTVRLYLLQLDREGLTRFVSRRRGRELTAAGHEELANANVVAKIGFIAPQVDALGYRMTFDPQHGTGTIVANVAELDRRALRLALKTLRPAFDAGWAMGCRLAVAGPGDVLAGHRVPEGKVLLGTICSVTVNGIMLAQGIPVTSRFGGLLEVRDGNPVRFTALIDYRGTTVDPLEAFIRAGMTSVRACCRTGHGIIGASFREIPSVAADAARAACRRMAGHGLSGVLDLGQPGMPLLEVPVAEGRTGMVVVGGLNPVAALAEAGIRLTLHSLAGLEDLDRFADIKTLDDALADQL